MAKLNINGKTHDVKVEADTPLLWAIREQVGLTGTKYGCGVAQCGACSVHINGEVERSCSIPVSQRQNHRQDRHHRRTVGEQLASGAEGLVGSRRAAVRLLPVGADDGGDGPAEEESEPERQGHRRSDDQHLPLRHLSAYSGRRAHGGRSGQGRRVRQSQSLGVGRTIMNNRKKAVLPNFPAANSSSVAPPPAAALRSVFICRSMPRRRRKRCIRRLEVNAWVVVNPDNTCVIRIARSEMGQGTKPASSSWWPKNSSATGKTCAPIHHAGTEPRAQTRMG